MSAADEDDEEEEEEGEQRAGTRRRLVTSRIPAASLAGALHQEWQLTLARPNAKRCATGTDAAQPVIGTGHVAQLAIDRLIAGGALHRLGGIDDPDVLPYAALDACHANPANEPPGILALPLEGLASPPLPRASNTRASCCDHDHGKASSGSVLAARRSVRG